ncbi:type I-E CRISPR-associated protein Cas5/CasD [Streptomyces poriferorum]|uniref:Type I-E CRISPR-associated protein Cas5/CasD n=1 Tax=Streptomyces poriferorum TaxID=2798799 RepID=A0ABY9IGH9_9ACTN|nr:MULTISPECIES: type I-E CRISPR-associated protein Cas5/CasD [unclassified Streptomyces]MDP5315656.1 type I-E CRISPR-associated protein Cas5/CasD [Streptomyces sp. Alt4]WLQ54024.1 type I-E CRISPR-associated protein Cas5/CasD [Streptomyces sp. Alt2]
MTGLVLRLAGLLQSSGERGLFHYRDTCAFPTRSQLIGMFAAAQGRPREHALDPYPHLQAPGDTTAPSHRDLTFTIRIDQPGTLYRDFHTVGGGYPRDQGLLCGDGTRRAQAKATLVSHRDYLTGAVFTIAVEGPAPLINHIAETLERPRFGLFLGRRACLPDEPLVLNPGSPDPVDELLTRTPLTRNRPPAPTATNLPTTFVWEHPPPGTDPSTPPDRESTSEPINLTTHARRHLPRPLWMTTEHLPTHLYAGPRPIDALITYVHGEPA